MKKRLLSLILVVTVMTMSVSGTFGTFTVSASGTYDTVPALVDVSPKYVIYEGTAFQGTFGSNGVTGQGHLPGYSSGSPAQKTFAAGSVSDYGRFEFDFYLDDASIVAARNIKLYLNLRVDTSVSGSRGTYEFQDQIIEDGWNHVIVDAGLADNILEALTITKFYIDMDASGTGASDRYKVANICATQEAYKVVPAMPDVSPRFDIQTGSAFSGTWGSNAVTGQGHLPGYSPAAKVFTNPGLSDYGCFEFDFYLDDVSIIATRNLKLYLNLRRANDSSITTFEYQDQITSSGWNHVKITTGMTDANLNDIGRIRFYIDIDAGSTGATDRYKVANICATQEAYKVVP
ncbi:MAG: hypothetical protein J6T73_05765, partial [Clostridia bacterium]|nr:hypothetical protein [Clostridia bacterium]